MKKIIGTLAIYASLAILTIASLSNLNELKAQTPTPAQTPAASTTCTDEVKGPLYSEFTKFRTTDPTKAYEAAKKYLAACPSEEGQIPSYLKKWVAAYDKEARKIKLNNLFDQAKYAESLPVAKEVLQDDPENVRALIDLGYGGYRVAVTSNNPSGNAEAISYAKKAIQAIEAGKTPENWNPFKSKDDTLGYLYFSVGFLERASNPADALKDFIKAAQFEGDIKKAPQTYALIAEAYETEYARLGDEYQKLYGGKDETPESKLAVANINQIVDRIIDARARSVAASGTDATAQAQKAKWLERLTELYKFRHNKSDAGLNEMIAGVLAKPLPPVPTPLTTLPAEPASAATSTTGGTSSSGTASSSSSAAGSMPGAAPKTTNTATAPTVTAPKPTTTTTTATAKAPVKPVVKPKTRNNHRRH
jgi:hypothetical protein